MHLHISTTLLLLLTLTSPSSSLVIPAGFTPHLPHLNLHANPNSPTSNKNTHIPRNDPPQITTLNPPFYRRQRKQTRKRNPVEIRPFVPKDAAAKPSPRPVPGSKSSGNSGKGGREGERNAPVRPIITTFAHQTHTPSAADPVVNGTTVDVAEVIEDKKNSTSTDLSVLPTAENEQGGLKSPGVVAPNPAYPKNLINKRETEGTKEKRDEVETKSKPPRPVGGGIGKDTGKGHGNAREKEGLVKVRAKRGEMRHTAL